MDTPFISFRCQALQDKRSIIVKAEGEAQSAKMISDAIMQNPAFIKLRKLEAARDIATIIARSQNRVFLNSDALLFNQSPDADEDGKHKK
jgi:prohibitin 2